MQLIVEKVGNVAVVLINVQQIDASNAEDFQRDMAPIYLDTNKLVLDPSPVHFVDSRGCGAILSCLKNVTGSGGDLKLCHVGKAVRNVFELIRLHRICEILNTRDEAVNAFKK